MDGAPVPSPKGAAEIDLTEIKAALADAVQQAEANDPKLLRAEIARLKKEAGKTTTGMVQLEPDELAREYRRGKIEGYGAAIGALQPMVDRMQTLRTALDEQLGDLIDDLAKWRERHESLGRESAKEGAVYSGPIQAPVKQKGQFAEKRLSSHSATSGTNGSLPKAERLILTALAQYPQGRTKNQVAILTGYAVNGGGFSNSISSLRTKGYLEGTSAHLVITPSGIAAVGDFEPLPHGQALLEHWTRQLGRAERKALEALAEVYPRTLSKIQLANRAGYEANGGGWNNALSRLRTLELITGRAELRASEALFD
jgi:hypothetical protein